MLLSICSATALWSEDLPRDIQRYGGRYRQCDHCLSSGRNVSAGLDVNFFAEADEGKQLDYWEINGERSDITDYTLATENLQAALDVVAHFKDAPADG